MHGAVILPDRKELEVNLGTVAGAEEISVHLIPIKHCPMCGREL